jgi:hypothetical protein
MVISESLITSSRKILRGSSEHLSSFSTGPTPGTMRRPYFFDDWSPLPNECRNRIARNFGLYGHAESKKAQKFVFRSALRPNQISFSHMGNSGLEPNLGSGNQLSSIDEAQRGLQSSTMSD